MSDKMEKKPGLVNGALRAALRQLRRLGILIVGTIVLLAGIVMIVTPGPATVVIPIGLAILALEFAWARYLLRRVKEGVETGIDKVTGGNEKVRKQLGWIWYLLPHEAKEQVTGDGSGEQPLGEQPASDQATPDHATRDAPS